VTIEAVVSGAAFTGGGSIGEIRWKAPGLILGLHLKQYELPVLLEVSARQHPPELTMTN
jgi:hypothetical protein